ncbi:L-seryl-tRNA(Sec) selenium transferase [Alkaliphilus sp. MSJ-5]|uniref:L-seryl-tRNA(Sec) selenium transferase n=1 Tax=Alkaliphilus flagellatus TaxID=2841507 RepID=A0ABS6G7M2_9FIRM|nr:L-seryl-tRNA(Sec) selenium transferase [Alkaliphilus flagellatus]MBU5677732.1 L-seryl-tRNA(Sec) selenium transferase [Alkaliphilus flagellatus]
MSKGKILSTLPSVDELLNHKEILTLVQEVPRRVVVNEIRRSIENYRKKILQIDETSLNTFKIDIEEIIYNIISNSHKFMRMNLREVINGTGTVLHTNLGRSLLSNTIKDEIWDIASGYSTLEIDVSTGKRGSRYSHVTEIIKFLTGAEDALVVNNNAAAVMLVLSTMAKNKEVIVSRGELVEIGGSFRVPDVMEQSGAKLVDIGTTNKTHLWDYENAIGENTAAFLKVHTSNYKILGFTDSVSVKDLVDLGKKNNVPVIEDLGSGVLVDLQKYGLTHEPTVQESVAAGADIVTFSGDKLLGGPQAGIIVGKKCFIDKMKKNPLTRAFRIDKLTMAALEATLKLYLDEENAIKNIPTLRMLTESLDSIKKRTNVLYEMISSKGLDLEVNISSDYSEVGGGSLPLEKLPTCTLTLKSKSISVSQLENKLRKYSRPIFTRVQDDRVIIDLRTIKQEQYEIIVQALVEVMK